MQLVLNKSKNLWDQANQLHRKHERIYIIRRGHITPLSPSLLSSTKNMRPQFPFATRMNLNFRKSVYLHLRQCRYMLDDACIAFARDKKNNKEPTIFQAAEQKCRQEISKA